jgi:hypothetical protein
MKDQPISEREIDQLYTLARKTSVYRAALLKQGLPEPLADQLARDWHMLQIQPDQAYGATDRLVQDLVHAVCTTLVAR